MLNPVRKHEEIGTVEHKAGIFIVELSLFSSKNEYGGGRFRTPK